MALVSVPASLWSAYFASRSDATLNTLIERYLPLVRLAAIRLASRFGRRAQAGDVDDLMQHGALGLREAISRFDPGRGVKFETFCSQRINGAMLDGLKKRHWLPRDLLRQVRKYAAVTDELHTGHGAGTHAAAAAERLGVREETIHELEVHLARLTVSSLHTTDEYEESPGESLVPDHREEAAPELQQREDVRQLLMRELTRSERHLMMLYYYDNLTMREIGEVLGISATRVSQLHTDIVARLREAMAARVTDERGGVKACLEI